MIVSAWTPPFRWFRSATRSHRNRVASVPCYVVALWFWRIIVNVLLGAGYSDIALRDFGLSLGALALARLSILCDDEHSVPLGRN